MPEAINATTALDVSFTFSEDVTGFDTDDVTVTGGSKGTFSGSAKSYSLAVTPGGTADVVVTVRANAATDGANQGPPQAVSATARWDTTAPAAPTFDPAGGDTVTGGRHRHHHHLQRGAPQRRQRDGVHHRRRSSRAILTLKVTNDTGTAIPYRGRPSTTPRMVITLDPASDLAEGAVYVAVSADHWDAAGNKGSAHSATFTVDVTGPAAPDFSPANAATVTRRHHRHHHHLRRGASPRTATPTRWPTATWPPS